MRILFTILTLTLFIGCSVQLGLVADNVKPKQDQSKIETSQESNHSIYNIDFRNFTYPKAEVFGRIEKEFTLKKGKYVDNNGIIFSLHSLKYCSLKSDSGETEVLVTINIDGGRANKQIIYFFELNEKGKINLLQSFGGEFNNVSVEHGELIIEVYQKTGSDKYGFDPECCPSIIERQHYQWKNDKFIMIEAQKIPNNYVERLRRNRNK